jgi:hypothetical protein
VYKVGSICCLCRQFVACKEAFIILFVNWHAECSEQHWMLVADGTWLLETEGMHALPRKLRCLLSCPAAGVEAREIRLYLLYIDLKQKS